MNKAIRILVDRSRDSGWSNGLVHIEPDNIYQTTDNRNYLNESILKNYDVLTICSSTPLAHTDEELKLIKEFVEAGGGLLLASSTSRFERDVGLPTTEMGINKVSTLFGAEFLMLDEGKGEMNSSSDPVRGYPKKSLRFTDHEVVTGLELDDLNIANCGILLIPTGAEVFLEHRETKEPIGASLNFGKGRVLLINDHLFGSTNHRVFSRFIDWLAPKYCDFGYRVSKAAGDEMIPDEIPIEKHVKEDGKIKIFYTDLVADKVDICLKFAKKLAKDPIGQFPKGDEITLRIELIPSCSFGFDWEELVMTIGAYVSNARLAYSLGSNASCLLQTQTHFRAIESMLCWKDPSAGIDPLLGIAAMRLLGFEREADAMCSEIKRQFRKQDPTGNTVDIAKINEEYSPKAVWILLALMEKYGDDLLIRLAKTIPEKDADKNMPRTTFSEFDTLVYYLSRTLEVDLLPWFQEIGTTVYPLPLHPNDSDEFKTGVRDYLNMMIRDKSANTSDRNDAISSILELTDKSEKTLSSLISKLGVEDKYERLIAARGLANACDNRAMKVLEELTFDADDSGLAAIAMLTLIQCSVADSRAGCQLVVDRLVEVAHNQDYRFQLDVGYVLEKLNHKAAEVFSYGNLRDSDGAMVVTMDVKRDRQLKLFPTVNGNRVANCFFISDVRHFPYNTHVNGGYVDWVWTKRPYRRKGLSRWAFAEMMSHEYVRRCSCAFLHTGTRNPAHAMYRSFGFVDIFPYKRFFKELQSEEAKVVEGIVIRSYVPGDETGMAEVANTFCANRLDEQRVRAKRRRPSETTFIKVAEKDSEILGYVRARCDWWEKEKVTLIEEFNLKETDNREEIGVMLLCALHNELVGHGYEKIYLYWDKGLETDFLVKLLYSFGYSSESEGGVWMFKVINLPMLLAELSPLFSKRLNESDDYKGWQGTISIESSEHHACITIDDGKINASAELPRNAAIRISTDDDTLTRVILGNVSPYEAYLQTDLRIEPTVNDSVTGLLDTLFPARLRKEN
ncbi:hypothetical protein H8E77_15160 [bacterium]|nr:hypothetical protein [bacterium]